MALNDTLEQMGYTYRTFNSKAEEYTYISSAHGTFSEIDYMLGHKTNLDIFKKNETISSMFSNHNAMRLESTIKEKTAKKYKHLKAK